VDGEAKFGVEVGAEIIVVALAGGVEGVLDREEMLDGVDSEAALASVRVS
jgi:hypothetical protein